MANIFKTTLKKDVIAEITTGDKKEVRFPITKFWATRLSDEYNLDEGTFVFKTFDSLELSSPSNKDNGGERYLFSFDRTYVDGSEFVVTFKDNIEEQNFQNDEQNVVFEENVPEIVVDETVVEEVVEVNETTVIDDDFEGSEIEFVAVEDIIDEEIQFIDEAYIFEAIKEWFDNKNILESLYDSEDVIATNARQVIVPTNGRILGSNKTLPVNNDAEVRIEFDMSEKVYFDATFDFEDFEEDILRTLSEIRKNNFVFVWKRNTGIFKDKDGVYFGIKYSTRKSIGFKRKYNVQ